MIRPTVLLISGTTDAGEARQRALEDAGLDVRVAPDGLHGMREALDETPDLVILDFEADDAPDVMRSRRALRQAGIPLLVLAAGHVVADDEAGGRGVSFLPASAPADRVVATAKRIIEEGANNSYTRTG